MRYYYTAYLLGSKEGGVTKCNVGVSYVWSCWSYATHHHKADDRRTGFEIAEGFRIEHGLDANIQHAVGQGSFILTVP